MTAQELIDKTLSEVPYAAAEGLSIQAHAQILFQANAAPKLARMLQAAIDDRDEAIAYVPDYFQRKWSLTEAQCNAKLDRIANGEDK